MNGQKVVGLFKGFNKSGEHRVNFNTTGVVKGIYLIKLTAGSDARATKILIDNPQYMFISGYMD